MIGTARVRALIYLVLLAVVPGCSLPFQTKVVPMYEGVQPESATARLTTYDRCHAPRLLAVDGRRLDYTSIGVTPWKIVVLLLPGEHLLDIAWMDCGLKNRPLQRSAPCTLPLSVRRGAEYEFQSTRPPLLGGAFEVRVVEVGVSAETAASSACKASTSW